MATITQTKLWKKMAVQADKLKKEVKKMNKSEATRSPMPKNQQNEDSVYTFASESPHHSPKLHYNYEETDEGVYEDFSSSDYSSLEEKSASAEDLRLRSSGHNHNMFTGNRLRLPQNVLHQKLHDFGNKTSSLPRHVKGHSNQLHTPQNGLHNAKSMENLSRPKKQALTPKHMKKVNHHEYRRENTFPLGQEREVVDNVLYNSTISVNSDDTFAQGSETYTYGVQKRNPLYSTSSTGSATDDRNRQFQMTDTIPSPQFQTQSRFKYTLNADPSTVSVNAPVAYSPAMNHQLHYRGDDFADEPVFGTIEPRYSHTYELSAAQYHDMEREETVYHEAGNFYDFE